MLSAAVKTISLPARVPHMKTTYCCIILLLSTTFITRHRRGVGYNVTFKLFKYVSPLYNARGIVFFTREPLLLNIFNYDMNRKEQQGNFSRQASNFKVKP
jgi:hypothetical protein